MRLGIYREYFLGKGRTTYHVDRVIRETGDIVNNGFSEIYVNAQIKDGTPTSELMTIYTDNEAYDNIKFPAISRRKRYFKKNRKGVQEMSEIMRQIKEDGQKQLIILMYHDGTITLPEACAYSKLSEEEFLALEKEYN